MTLDEIRNIVIGFARIDNFEVVCDRNFGNSKFVEIREENDKLLLYMEATYRKFICDFLKKIIESLETTNYTMEHINIDSEEGYRAKCRCGATIRERS